MKKNYIETELHKNLLMAIENQEFRLFYQPKLDLISGKIIGVEALIRWERPGVGLISPDEFIPCTEESGLIVSIGEWILKTACKQNKQWQKNGLPYFTVAVNLSVRQLYQFNLVEVIERILFETGLSPQYLELEITESMVVDVSSVLPIMIKLKEKGIRISLDDFGKGYSSLFHLKEFPIDILKIDKSFIRSCIEEESKDATILKAVIAMAKQLNIEVIAEGVETKEQLKFLQKNQCNQAQGFLFSKPLPAEELEKRFHSIEQVILK